MSGAGPGPLTEAGPCDQELTNAVSAAMRGAGLASVGVAPVERFESTRQDLVDRRARGLHGGMAFTYRNPDRSTDPARILAGARSLVVGARGYLRHPGPARDGAVVAGRVARYAWSDHYRGLRRGLRAGARVLEGAGFAAVVVADDNALVDREAARRAGIGWYGRNANLLLPGKGSWYVLGTVVTDAPLTPSTPVAPGCGTCTRCLGACPTGAIVAPGVVDARRCLAWLVQAPGAFPREHRAALGDRMYGCDDCQEVCPPNLAADRAGPAPAGPEDRPMVDVAPFLDDDDTAVLAAAGRWYVPRRDARYLRRNALIVLGNAGDPQDPRVIALLRRSLDDGDPLVRGHAVWAAARLGRPDLADGLEATEADPMVREELARRADVPSRTHP